MVFIFIVTKIYNTRCMWLSGTSYAFQNGNEANIYLSMLIIWTEK